MLAAGLALAPPAAAAPQPWRIALVAGGPFFDYQIVLKGLAERLAERGIIDNGAVPRPENDESLAPMWQWLAENAGGDTLVFAADAFYSPAWNPDQRPEVKRDLLERLRERGDIDCVLALGTWAGQDIKDLEIPVLAISASNAVEAGIIPSPDDSGRDNLMATIEPDRYKRQIRIFRDIIGFSKLGLAYEDTPSWRAGIALGEIEAAAAEMGVELLRCTNIDSNITDAALSANLWRACYEDLAKEGADAIYVAYMRGLGGERVADALEPLIKAGVPTFAQEGTNLVREGVMLGMSGDNVKEEGFFAAEALEKILGGALPRSLPQRYQSGTSLAVNLRTAVLIGWNPPMEVLAVLDEVYRDF